MSLPMRVDVAILGAGAAGMFVALGAAARGLSVALIDPHWNTPNNFALSGGLFPAAGSALQRAAGVVDHPEAWLADLRAFAPGAVNERVAAAVAHALPDAVGFLAGPCGAPLRYLADVVAPGHGRRRFHSVEPASGAAFHAWFRQAVAAQRGIAIHTSQAEAVVRTAQGFELDTGSQHLAAMQLVLAGGGFAGHTDLVRRYIPAMAGALHNGSPTNDGSVMQLGIGWGAQLWGMDGYQGQGHTHPGGRTRLGMAIPPLGGILVNRDGRRFVAEDVGPSALAPHVLAQPGGQALEVFDDGIAAQLANHSAYADAERAGRVITAATLAELAQAAGVPAAALAATLDEVNQRAAGRRVDADPLGRSTFPRVLAAPFKASWVTGALSHTQGGLVTDSDGRVLDADESPLAGVFAVGGCAAGLSGHGAEGYLPGNGLAQAFGLGWRLTQALG